MQAKSTTMVKKKKTKKLTTEEEMKQFMMNWAEEELKEEETLKTLKKNALKVSNKTFIDLPQDVIDMIIADYCGSLIMDLRQDSQICAGHLTFAQFELLETIRRLEFGQFDGKQGYRHLMHLNAIIRRITGKYYHPMVKSKKMLIYDRILLTGYIENHVYVYGCVGAYHGRHFSPNPNVYPSSRYGDCQDFTLLFLSYETMENAFDEFFHAVDATNDSQAYLMKFSISNAQLQFCNAREVLKVYSSCKLSGDWSRRRAKKSKKVKKFQFIPTPYYTDEEIGSFHISVFCNLTNYTRFEFPRGSETLKGILNDLRFKRRIGLSQFAFLHGLKQKIPGKQIPNVAKFVSDHIHKPTIAERAEKMVKKDGISLDEAFKRVDEENKQLKEKEEKEKEKINQEEEEQKARKRAREEEVQEDV